MTPQQALGGGWRSRPFPRPGAHFAQRRRQLLLTAGEGGFQGNLNPPFPRGSRARRRRRSSGRAPPLNPSPPPSVTPGALQRRQRTRGGVRAACACAGCGAFLALSGAQPPEAAGAGGCCYGNRAARRAVAGGLCRCEAGCAGLGACSRAGGERSSAL